MSRQRALADAHLPDALAAWILAAAGQRPVVPGTLADSPAPDTILEVDSMVVTLTSKDPTDWQPGLRLRLSVGGRLVRAWGGGGRGRWGWDFGWGAGWSEAGTARSSAAGSGSRTDPRRASSRGGRTTRGGSATSWRAPARPWRRR